MRDRLRRAATLIAFPLTAAGSGCGALGTGGSVATTGALRAGDDARAESAFHEEEVTFTSGELRLVGTLAIPEGPGPSPAVVLLSGSGPQDREGETPGFVPGYQPSRDLAEYLAARGVASLRYDERGVGGSTGHHASASTADLSDDAEAGFLYLRSRSETHSDQVGLIGQSEGANIVAMVTARNPAVAFAIALAGAAVSGHEIVLAQSEHALRETGLTGPELEAAMARVRAEYDLVLQGEWDTLEATMRAVLPAQLEAMPPEQRASLGTPEEIIAEELARMQSWVHFFLMYDPADDWGRARVPVLALFGGLDVQVPVAQNRAPLEAALRRAPTEDWNVRVFPTANHLFQEAESGNVQEYFLLEPGIDSEVLDAISSWIRDRFSAEAPVP